MDDGTPIAKTETSLDAAIASMDAHDGFAVLRHKGREIILMTDEKFETWEDAVDCAAIERSIANPDPNPISLEDLAAELDIVLPSQRKG
jgi:hypothetical protein